MEIKLGLLFRIAAGVFAIFSILSLAAAVSINTPWGQSMASFLNTTFTAIGIVLLAVATGTAIRVAVTGKL